MNLEQQRLGDYVLAEPLRQDRTGVVYRGRHATRDTEVAIKILDERWSQDLAVVARWTRDASVLQRVAHPGIAAVLDHGTSERGLYLVTESLAGESLAQRLAREPRLSLAETQEIVGAVASALAAAHRARLVHRDLTPECIFLARAGAGVSVKVLDLGLAKLLADPAKGSSKEVDQRADIHALGRVAYQMLSGQLPAESSVPSAGAASPRTRPARLATLGVTVPAAVEAALMKALAPKKKRRFSSMAEFAQAFGAPISAPPAPAPDPQPIAPPALPPAPIAVAPRPSRTLSPAPGPERSTTLAGLVAPLRELGRQALGRRQLVAGAGGVLAAILAIGWLTLGSGDQAPPVVVDKHPPPVQRPDRKHPPPAPQPPPPVTAPSRVDEILALNQQAVTAYRQSNVKRARALLHQADQLAVASGYQTSKVRAQTQIRLGALSIAAGKNPRLGRRYLAKAIAMNPAVQLPAGMNTPAVRKAVQGARLKARVASARPQKRAGNGKPTRRHAPARKRAG